MVKADPNFDKLARAFREMGWSAKYAANTIDAMVKAWRWRGGNPVALKPAHLKGRHRGWR